MKPIEIEASTVTYAVVTRLTRPLKCTLQFQKLTDTCMQQVAYEALLQNQCTELDLSGNKFTDVGVAILAPSLSTNQVRINNSSRLYRFLSFMYFCI